MSAFILLVYLGSVNVAPDFWRGVLWPWYLGERLCRWALDGGDE